MGGEEGGGWDIQSFSRLVEQHFLPWFTHFDRKNGKYDGWMTHPMFHPFLGGGIGHFLSPCLIGRTDGRGEKNFVDIFCRKLRVFWD